MADRDRSDRGGRPDADERRRLRQQRELVHGSGAPRSLARALAPRTPLPDGRGRRWKDKGRAERLALIQTHIVPWAALLLVAYPLATKLGAVACIAYLGVMPAGFAYIGYLARRCR